MGLDLGRQMDDIMQFCSITIIASVEPHQPWSRNRLDDLESDLQDRVMCFEKHGVVIVIVIQYVHVCFISVWKVRFKFRLFMLRSFLKKLF